MGEYSRFLGGVGVSLDRNDEGKRRIEKRGRREDGKQIGRDHPWFVGRGS